MKFRQAYGRAVLALKLEPLLKKKAKENQEVRKGKQAGSSPQKSAELKPIETRKEIAAAAHVSHDTIAKVKTILTWLQSLKGVSPGSLQTSQRNKFSYAPPASDDQAG